MKKRAYPLVKALFAWIENRPLPFGTYVIHEDIHFDFPSDIPLQVLSYITRLREEKETSDSLTVVVRHLKQAFKDLILCSQEPYHQEQPIYLYKTLGVLLNFTAQTTCSNLIPAVVSAINLAKDTNLPSEWQDELAEAFLYAVFQLAYHGCNESQKLKSAPISAGVNKFLSDSLNSDSLKARRVSKKNYLIFLLLICMLGKYSTGRMGELIAELNQLKLIDTCHRVMQHIKSSEDWYKDALYSTLTKDRKLLNFIKNNGLQDVYTWYVECNKKKSSPRGRAPSPRAGTNPLFDRYLHFKSQVGEVSSNRLSTLTRRGCKETC